MTDIKSSERFERTLYVGITQSFIFELLATTESDPDFAGKRDRLRREIEGLLSAHDAAWLSQNYETGADAFVSIWYTPGTEHLEPLRDVLLDIWNDRAAVLAKDDGCQAIASLWYLARRLFATDGMFVQQLMKDVKREPAVLATLMRNADDSDAARRRSGWVREAWVYHLSKADPSQDGEAEFTRLLSSQPLPGSGVATSPASPHP